MIESKSKRSLREMGKEARAASREMARASTDQKNEAILALADILLAETGSILRDNEVDVRAANTAGLSAAMIDRLTLNPSRLQSMSADLRNIARLPDPVGECFDQQVLPNGLQVHKQRVPLGVIGVIYESRPNVTIDVAGLAIKTGNAIFLRGGSETIHSNLALVQAVRRALVTSRLPVGAVQFIANPDRALVAEMLELHDFIDMLIPRGGAALHDFCRKNSRIPVITGGIGICHLFVDESADLDGALQVIYNAKVQRPTVCNALDTVLVHRRCAEGFLPRLVRHLQPAGVSFRAHPSAMPFLASMVKSDDSPGEGGDLPAIKLAGPDDFDTEWLSLVLGIKVVADVAEAIAHIEKHSTGHSDGILTRDDAHARRFVAEVDSAAVYVNASTRFTDGGQLGLGAEVAISTQRLHARGPMGLRELTTYKWVITGQNHVRSG